jgi:PAS domain S-box-containing protein
MNKLRSMSIRNQIITLIILMTLLPMGIIVYIAVDRQQHEIDEAIELTGSVANQIQNDQKILLTGAEQLAATLSILPVVKRHDAAAVSSMLTELVKTNPHFSNVIIVDRTGSLWASAIPSKGSLSYSDRRYFKNAVASGRISSGEYTIGKISPYPVLSFAYPIKDHSGAVSDVMAVVFSLNRYNQLYGRDKGIPTSSILLVDHQGTILYSSVDARLIGKQDRPDLFARMTGGPNDGTFEANGNLGVRRIFSYRKLWLKGESSPYMYIRTGLDKDYVLTKARKDLMLGAGVLLPAMLVMLGMAIFFCKRSILDKISALLDTTQKIARGDLTVRVPDHVSGSELGELGGAFNEMAQRLQLAYEAQRESENKYRELVEKANCIILKWDIDGRVIYFNEFAERFFGFSSVEIIGRNLIGTIVPETDSSGRDLVAMIGDICKYPDAYINNENENICKNGERVWISWNNHVLVNADGSKAGILSVGQDITERKRIEKELRKSEQRFRSFVENVNDIVFALAPSGIFSYVSPNWKDAFGYDLEETIGHSFVPFVHPDDVPVCLEFLKKAIETGEKQSGAEYRVRHKNGDWIWYRANGSLTRDVDSDADLFIGIGRDITELKMAEETLRQSEEKFSAAFRASPDAITLTRLCDGAYLEVNEGYTAITGYLPEEVIGKTSTGLNTWVNPQDRLQLLHDLHVDGIVKNKEFKLRRKDGSILIGLMSVRIIEINGEQCLLGITRDVTEREFLQNELIKAQKLESISVLAGGIAHNFNNVLTGVIGYISYAKKHLGDANKVLQTLDSAENASYRAAGLARQLLTFSQSGSSDRKPVSVDDLVQESVSLFLSGSNINGTITCESHQKIYADSLQISQAFNNIVLNALHAMPDGGALSVHVDSMTLDEDNRYSLQAGNYVKIVFEDSGCGIEKDDLIKVYDPYFTTKESGTGLGLSTTHTIICKHGGHIDIASEVGKGTCVSILLPSTAA